MSNLIGGLFGVVLLVAGIVVIAVAFAVSDTISGFVLFAGILLITASIGLPVWLLDRLEG